MAKHWKEIANLEKHIDYMSTSHVGGIALKGSPEKDTAQVYFVQVEGFTFQFVTLDQLDTAIAYFSDMPPASRASNNGLEHFWQRWYERLPKGMTKKSKRAKVLKALNKARNEFSCEDSKGLYLNNEMINQKIEENGNRDRQ